MYCRRRRLSSAVGAEVATRWNGQVTRGDQWLATSHHGTGTHARMRVAGAYGGRLSISPASYWRMSAASMALTPSRPFTSALGALGREGSRPATYWRMNSASMLLTTPSAFTSPTGFFGAAQLGWPP